MEEPTQLIPNITDQSSNWAVRVTVTESIPIMQCSNGSALKRYILTDKKGNEVLASVYGEDIQILEPMINLYGVYDISNARVKLIDKEYQIIRNPFQWTLKPETLIRSIPEADATLDYLVDSITPFSRIIDADKSEIKTADIMGIMIHADKVKSVNYNRNEVQHFIVVDIEKIPLRLSLWDAMIASQGPMLIEAANNRSVILAKRLTIRSFDGISLSAKNATSFAINPPIKVARDLKAWFDSIPETEI